MLERCREILTSSYMLVLATQGANGPHASLMFHVFDEANNSFLIVTSKDTLKYKNLSKDGRVSLLVDTRLRFSCEKPTDKVLQNVQAITVTGAAEELTGESGREAIQTLSSRHSALVDTLTDPDVAVFSIKATQYKLLTGPNRIETYVPDDSRQSWSKDTD